MSAECGQGMGASGSSPKDELSSASCGLREKGAAAELETFSTATPFDVHCFEKALNAWLEPWHMECTPPWLVGWYNDSREKNAGGEQRIPADDGAVAFAICSVPNYLDVVVEHYARSRPDGNFIHAATNEIMERLQQKLPTELEVLLVNTDVGPPYYHVQTIGAVCGRDQHIEAVDILDDEWREELQDDLEDTRDPKMWGADSEMLRKIFGVNVHPTYGGWYAYRMLLVLRGVNNTCFAESLVQPAPHRFVEKEDAKRILREYNLQHEFCVWRDLTVQHPPRHRYSPEEYLYFTEQKAAKRKRFLEYKTANFTEVPPLRG